MQQQNGTLMRLRRFIAHRENFKTIFYVFLTLGTMFILLQEDNQAPKNYDQQRCHFELTSCRYKLKDVQTEQQEIQAVLSETEKLLELEKKHYKEAMDNCTALKQQDTIRQSQFDDMAADCKKLKEECTQFKDGKRGFIKLDSDPEE